VFHIKDISRQPSIYNRYKIVKVNLECHIFLSDHSKIKVNMFRET